MKKILIVDDDEMMITIARRILAKKYEIVTATTGAEAIELFETEKPDMVLSDLMMPEMDGYELHRILQEKSLKPVPMMFMTADDSGESESKGFELGAADYIRKPLRPDVLTRRVDNIIENLDKIHTLENQASTDPLTKLLNKSAAQKEIGELVKTSRGTLLMLDLDSFKLVNDIHGHGVGDKILIHFGELIKKIIRENDLAGRMGGDEFIAFLINVDDEKILRQKADFLNEELLIYAKKLMGEDMQIPLGTSIGAVLVPNEGTDFTTLYKKADAALYTVKQNGKHGMAIFGARENKGDSAIQGISQMQMILGERNIEPGAYFVDFETFKKIYRLMCRTVENYNKSIMLLQFTLSSENNAEEFKDILVHSLKKSDCVTQNVKIFLALITEDKPLIVRDRIFSKLGETLAKEIKFESEKLS